MHARVTTVMVQPGKVEEATRIFRDIIMAQVKQLKGFKGAMLLTDPDTGKGISVTVWDSKEDMIAVEASGKWAQMVGEFAAVLSGPPTREHYEVSVQV